MPDDTKKSEGLGRNGFAAIGGAVGLAVALVVLSVIPPPKLAARPAAAGPPASQSPVAPKAVTIATNPGPTPTADRRSPAGAAMHAEPPATPIDVKLPSRQSSSPAALPDSSHTSPPLTTYSQPPARPDYRGDSTACGFPLADGTTCRNHVSGGGYCYLHSTRPEPSYSGGGTVNVRGFYRKDGTYVRPHSRRAPRR